MPRHGTREAGRSPSSGCRIPANRTLGDGDLRQVERDRTAVADHLPSGLDHRLVLISFFRGYHFSPEGLTPAANSIEPFVARAIRLYEQEPGEA